MCPKFGMPREMKKGLYTTKFDRCMDKVESGSGKKANPYAVCDPTMGGRVKNQV